ncbi:MAG: 5'-3' exonuclease [Actinomycetia bacterium]|nr:5'-3' exonuclease [Actinomycetes bacterium]
MVPTSRLMLLDSASMYFRAFHGVPESITAPDGTPIGAVRGFLDAITRILTNHPATDLVACFDTDWRPQWRVDLVPGYKAHRVAVDQPPDVEEVPDALAPQVPVIEAVLDALGVARAGATDFEADDVMATLARAAAMPVDIVTGDRDLFQLAEDVRPTTIVYIGKGFAKAERITDGSVQERYDVPASSYADFATLRGDPSDGLPGVKGVGGKSAATVVAQFPTIESLLAAMKDPSVDVPHRAKIEPAIEYLTRAIEVVRVRTNVAVPELSSALPRTPADPETLENLTARWGIARSVNRLIEAMARAA